jgi:glutaconate CoA-transferase, subunit B
MNDYSADEVMTVAAARELTDRTVCFVGIGLPSTAANLARLTHAPRTVLVYESGTIGSKPATLPMSIGDGVLRLDPDERELVLTHTHPGVWVDRVRAETGWDLRVAGELAETEPPSDDELRVLRGLRSALEQARA